VFEALVPPLALAFTMVAEFDSGLDDSQEGAFVEVFEVDAQGGVPLASGRADVPGAEDVGGLVDEEVAAGDAILLYAVSPGGDGEGSAGAEVRGGFDVGAVGAGPEFDVFGDGPGVEDATTRAGCPHGELEVWDVQRDDAWQATGSRYGPLSCSAGRHLLPLPNTDIDRVNWSCKILVLEL
jgi:hypothetical protein